MDVGNVLPVALRVFRVVAERHTLIAASVAREFPCPQPCGAD
jgi:hypothetical protein